MYSIAHAEARTEKQGRQEVSCRQRILCILVPGPSSSRSSPHVQCLAGKTGGKNVGTPFRMTYWFAWGKKLSFLKDFCEHCPGINQCCIMQYLPHALVKNISHWK